MTVTKDTSKLDWSCDRWSFCHRTFYPLVSDCQSPLGLASGYIADSQITASGHYGEKLNIAFFPDWILVFFYIFLVLLIKKCGFYADIV